jgi:hypothetical protein
MSVVIGSGLCTAFHLGLNVFRISTCEVDSYITMVMETSLSVALTGMSHYLSQHNSNIVSDIVINYVKY